MKKVFSIALIITIALGLISCNKFLNIVPDDTATIQRSFKMKNQAKQYLYTLYSYLPRKGFIVEHGRGIDPGLGATDGIITPDLHTGYQPGEIRAGNQKVVDPYLNYWEGRNGGNDLYQAIRDCNIFLKNIHEPGNMTEQKKQRWAAEAKFLKAFYYFYLIRMYGPVMLYKHNLPASAPKRIVDVPRAPTDSCFNYVIKLLNEAIHTPALPARITNRVRNLGRITKSIAYALKMKVEVLRASPLFNGNQDYVGFKNKKGINPFDTKYKPAKWDSAAVAGKQAIDYLTAHNFKLYQYQATATNGGISDSLKQTMTIRNSLTSGRKIENTGKIWSPAVVSGYKQYEWFRQGFNIPRGLNAQFPANGRAQGREGVTLKIAQLFYTNHGVPIDQDTSWNYRDRFAVRTVKKSQRFHLKPGYKTAYLNMYRGPRFYADLGFDSGLWYGNGIYSGGPSKYRYIEAKKGQLNWYSTHEGANTSITGYWEKKLVNYKTRIFNLTGHSYSYYNWPRIRLAEIYLLYAEAKNESDGPGPQVFKYLNLVRERAGLPPVKEAWNKWSRNPGQYKTKTGLRKIIHHEELIEFAFEGQRFWDLRRWKELTKVANGAVRGWNRQGSTAKEYYKPTALAIRNYTLKDYLWPISEKELLANPMLTQNPGWGR
jgi:hypothetical protein